MSDIIFPDTNPPADLLPLFVGHEECESGYNFGPYVRDYYLLHFCIGGQGALKNRHGTYTIRKGQLFIIRPGEVTTYTADREKPWEYVWIAFRGRAAAVFDPEPSVLLIPGGVEEHLTEHIKGGTSAPEIYLSILYELIYSLFCEQKPTQTTDKLRQIKRYINYNYMLPLTVEGIAKSFGFERSYLFRLFKARYGVGLKEYIIRVRMRCAMHFLEDGCSVSECARLVGYEDEFNFSKAFKKHYGYSPSGVYRRSIR
ncbi:MAG: AraC family transcriptional regulator [Clostridia bacterium]|nr:AraC family transcriptional regulator [Clostridia bacterium]